MTLRSEAAGYDAVKRDLHDVEATVLLTEIEDVLKQKGFRLDGEGPYTTGGPLINKYWDSYFDISVTVALYVREGAANDPK